MISFSATSGHVTSSSSFPDWLSHPRPEPCSSHHVVLGARACTAQVGLGHETRVHRRPRGVVLGHRGQPSNNSMVRSMEDVVVQARVHVAALGVRRDDQPTVRRASTWSGPSCASSSINEYGGLGPVARAGDALHKLTHGVVGVGHHGARVKAPRALPLCEFSGGSSRCSWAGAWPVGRVVVLFVRVELADELGTLSVSRMPGSLNLGATRPTRPPTRARLPSWCRR